MTRLLILLLFLQSATYGQKINTTTGNGQRSIYNDAIKHYITFVSKSEKSIFSTLLILKDDVLTDSLVATIQGSQIVILDSTEISKRIELDKSFIAHRIFPINFDNGYFYINIVPFRVHKNNGEIFFENSGTCVVTYTYDNNKKEFIFYRSACTEI